MRDQSPGSSFGGWATGKCPGPMTGMYEEIVAEEQTMDRSGKQAPARVKDKVRFIVRSFFGYG